MSIVQPDGSLRLSPSALGMLSRCGYQFERIYMAGERFPPGIALLAGSGVHRGVEINMSSKITRGEPAPIEAVMEAAANEVERRALSEGVELDPDDDRTEKAALGEATDSAVNLASLHHRDVAPAIEPIACERKFELSAGGGDSRPIVLSGVIDIEERASIIDTKTAGKAPPAGAADASNQLTAYALARHAEGNPAPEQHLDFLVSGAKGARHVRQTTRRSKADMETYLARVTAAARVIRAGAFFPTDPSNWWCSERFCGLARRGVCPYRNLGRKVIAAPSTGTREETRHDHTGKQ